MTKSSLWVKGDNMLKFKIQTDPMGQFRIVGTRGGIYPDLTSIWVPYTGIAVLKDGDDTYMAVSGNWVGTLPTNTVLKVIREPAPTLQEVERLLDENKQERVFVRSPLTAVSD